MRVACVLVTHLRAKVEMYRHPHLKDMPVVIVDRGTSGTRPLVVDHFPKTTGVRAGMTLEQAISRHSNAVVLDADEPYYRRTFAQMLSTLQGVSDRVEGAELGTAYVRIDGLEGLYGGEARVVSALLNAAPAYLSPRVGVADAKFPAFVAAWTCAAHGAFRVPEDVGAFLAPHSINLLPLSEGLKRELHRFGLSSRSARRAESLRILAVDDDLQALRYVRDTLMRSGFEPMVTADPEEVLRLVEEYKPHLVLLDLVLPGVDGMDLMKDIAEMTDVPVIFLSAYGQDRLVARAFDMGAADYMVKPFSPTELSARIRAALRRREVPKPSEPYVLGDLTIDYDERRVTLAGRPVELTAKEYGTLAELSANAGRVLTYETLLRRVWGLDADADIRPMRTVISSIRRKLGDAAEDSKYVLTELRVGYRMPKGEKPGQETEPPAAP